MTFLSNSAAWRRALEAIRVSEPGVSLVGRDGEF
jgi:hypothetical protein